MNEYFRILDANVNRICEGIRVLEDVARFTPRYEKFFPELRKIRRRIRKKFENFDEHLLVSRNSMYDPGVVVSAKAIAKEIRTTQSILKANFKRIQEGLRVVAETCRLLARVHLASWVETQRFLIYDMEKSFLTSQKLLPRGLYAITAEKFSRERNNLEVVKQLLEGGIDVLQYREKPSEKSYRVMLKECKEIRKMTRDYGVPFIINDYLELAHMAEADGVHIGQDDYPIQEVRRWGGDLLIGVSTHSPQQAKQAIKEGADYIGVGPLFPTQTKDNVCKAVGLGYLEYICNQHDIPHVAIGGIKRDNIKQVLSFPVWSVCLVTGLVAADDIKREVKQIKQIMKEGHYNEDVYTN